MNTLKDNLVGQQFGHLTVVALNGKTKLGQSIWKCQCSCGNFKNIRGYHLKGKKIRSCGCLRRETVNIKWAGCGEIGGYMWSGCKLFAKRRNIKFDITIEDMWEQAVKQNKKCTLSGTDLIFCLRTIDKIKSNASLDRIDSSKGYTKDNIQWVTKKINMLKGVYSQTEFIKICKSVAKNFQ